MKLKGRSIPFLFLATIVLFFYLLCRQLECLPYFFAVVGKVMGVLATRKILFLLPGIRGFSLAVRLLLPALINAEGIPLIGNMMLPAGASGPSNALPSSGPRWDIDLNKIPEPEIDLPPLGEEEIQAPIDADGERDPIRLFFENKLREKISQKRDAIRGIVEGIMRTEIQGRGVDPDSEIVDLEGHVNDIIREFANQFPDGDLKKEHASLSCFLTLLSRDDNPRKNKVINAITKAVRESL